MNSKEKISSQEIIDLVATKASVSKRAAEEFLKVMIATIEEALLAGETVKVKGFGTFKLQWNAPRKSVNVQTGEDFIIDGYYKVNFAPERSLKDLVNEPFAHLEPVLLDGEVGVEPEKEVISEKIARNNEVKESDSVLIKESEKEADLLEVIDDLPEPLRIFSEQAAEIKDILSEINALSAVSKSGSVEESTVEDFHYEVDTFEIDEEKPEQKDELTGEEVVVGEDETEEVDDEVEEDENEDVEEDDEEVVVENIQAEKPEIESELELEAITEVESESEIEENTEDSNILETTVDNSIEVSQNEEYETQPASNYTPTKVAQKTTNKKKLWFIPLASIVVIGILVVLYLSIPTTNQSENVFTKKIENSNINFKSFFSELYHKASDWLTINKKQPVQNTQTIVIPKDTNSVDALNEEQSKDSLQILFDTPRVYPEYIASEQITNGSRLAWMSKKYYGLSDFWVYIYEANKDRFDDPDKIPVGALIRIPKLDPRLIDSSNPRCVDYAKKLHDEYVKR